MKIFTERGFREELERRREAAEEAMYFRRRFEELEDKIERLYRIVEDLRLNVEREKTYEKIEYALGKETAEMVRKENENE